MGRGVEEDQVGPSAHAQVADVGPAQGFGAARGGGPDRLLGGHPHVADGQRDAERHAGGERGARVAVGGQGHRGPGVQQPPRVRVGVPGAELGSGQQRRDQRGGHDRVQVFLADIGAVVGGGRAGLRSDADAGPGSELVGVDAGAQAAGPARGQDRGGLVGAERPVLAEHVDPPGVRRARVQHRAAHQVHVAGHVAGELGRHDVRAEVGDLGRDLAGQRERAGLVGHGQAVAGLALERGRALAGASRPPAGAGWRAARCRRRPGSRPPS